MFVQGVYTMLIHSTAPTLLSFVSGCHGVRVPHSPSILYPHLPSTRPLDPPHSSPTTTPILFRFAYQTLDAVDGKQARKIGLSSAMGSLCDHGCDTIVMWWNGLAVLLSLDMTGGGMKETLCMCTFLSCMSSFMLPQWEHFYRGKLEHSGVTEGQFFAMIFPLLAYICGFTVFLETELQMIVSPNTTVAATGLAAQMKMGLGEAASRAVYAVYAPTTHVMEPLMMGACLYPLALSVATVVRVAMLRNGSGFDPCITILPWLVHIAATVLMVTSGMLARHGLIVYLLMGCQFSKCSLRMVVRVYPHHSIYSLLHPIFTPSLP